MNNSCYLILFSLVVLSSYLIVIPHAAAPNRSLTTTTEVNHEEATALRIGIILDQTSRPGKEAKVAIQVAIHDYNTATNPSVLLYFRDSKGKPVSAALAAKGLIDTHGVKAIVGAHTLEEAWAIGEAANEASHVPPICLFLVDVPPPTTPTDHSFIIQASPSQHAQTNAIASIIKSWGFRRVTLIYENLNSISINPSLFISQLSHAFNQTNIKITNVIPFTSFSTNSLNTQLQELKKNKSKAFVVHTSLESGFQLYQMAKKLEMTGDGFAWITTNRISDLFHSISPTKMSSIQGLIGIKTYFPENSQPFETFRKKFITKFITEYPDEDTFEPGIYAAQAYDAMQAIFSTNVDAKKLIASFDGLSGRIQFNDTKLSPAKTVEIVKVMGKSYQSGYWTKGLGFSENVEDGAIYDNSMEILGRNLWPPVQLSYGETRRRIQEDGEEPLRLKVGVPANSLFRQFVSVEKNSESDEKYKIDGFSIKVFEELVNGRFLYDYEPFNGSYTELMQQIELGKYDAVAGDVTITAQRHNFADFSQPYTESGMEMIVPIRSKSPDQIWLFMKPFTTEMWGLIAAITLFNGFTVWLIERKHSKDLRGSIANQIGVIFWLSFATLFTLQGKKLHSNSSRIAMVVWLFVALIITQSYTASLASMLTAQRLEPKINSVETLRTMNATVGHCNGSFVPEYMKRVLGFKSFKIKNYNSTDAYAKALNTGEIAAIFLDAPVAKLFLAQYCTSFTKTKETFKVGGFGFAFQKNFSLLPEINRALMDVTESGKLLELEKNYIVSEKCVDLNSNPREDESIGLSSFWVLFVLSGGTSTVALLIYAIRFIKKLQKSRTQHRDIYKFLSVVSRHWRRSSSIVRPEEGSTNHTDGSNDSNTIV